MASHKEETADVVNATCSSSKKRRTNKHADDESSSSPFSELQRCLLDWSNKQSRILTGDGKAVDYYKDFPFEDTELPHYHLQAGDTHQVFSKWSKEQQQQKKRALLICGAWTRPLFYGGWEYSTSGKEYVFNVQTPTLFVDLRIPKSKSHVLPRNCASVQELDDLSLRLYARQHVFAGFTKLSWETNKDNGISKDRPFCTRHHCIDWNFVGIPRPIPNKWYVEMADTKQKWKEWAYATDEIGQHYYCEHWERLEHGGDNTNDVMVALRQKQPSTKQGGSDDGVLVVVQDHFNYVFGRTKMTGKEKKYPNAKSLVELVDVALAAGDRVTAESYLSIDAGHGRVSKGWLIDCAIQPWKEGTSLLTTTAATNKNNNDSDTVVVKGGDDDTDDKLDETCCQVLWKGRAWEISYCSLSTVSQLKKLFSNGKVQ